MVGLEMGLFGLPLGLFSSTFWLFEMLPYQKGYDLEVTQVSNISKRAEQLRNDLEVTQVSNISNI